MGDRNNPIKFGPEWLRNLARERNAGSASNNQSGAGASPGIDAQSGAATAMQSTATGIAHNTPKVLLAKLRYGREEMLALYDRSAEAPPELVYNDALYQPRGNPPIALMNTFEGEVREPVRSGPPMGGLSTGDRFGVSRGLSQGSIVEGRGRGRQPFVRQTSVGNKRPGSNTNWRQSRDEDEWRNNDSSRQRSMHSDKWDRDWGDRPNTDKPQSSWNTNRRTWVGGDEDNLPEWAVDNAEACGGTFDSSGAFHGYSNDDTNLPKQDASYQLTRSHTHDSFVRSKPAEEGSEEWWASEKANKLSPNRFDAVEIKFKETSTSSDGRKTSMLGSSGLDTRTCSSKDNLPPNKVQDKQDVITPSQGQSDGSTSLEDTFDRKAVRFAESKTFDALMRSDINLDEANDEGGNFQSVMITPNNSLRQKHQNIVAHQNYAASVDNATNQQKRKSGILQILQNVTSDKESQSGHTQQSQEDRVVENIMELTLKDRNIKEMPLKQPQTSDSLLMNPPACLSSVLASRSQRQMLPVHPSQLDANKMMPTPNMGLQGVQSLGSQYLGMDYMALNAALGFRPLGPAGETVGGPVGIQSVPPPVLPGSGLMSGAVPMPGFPNASPSPMPSNAGANLNAFGQMVNAQAQQPSEMSMPNLGGQAYMFPTHCLQPSGSQNEFGSSIYSNIMQHPPTSNAQTPNSLADQWYYEDPKKNIQGPFSSRDMYNWYQAGFFTPSLMVRRATDTMMRPLGSYGPSVPFAQMDILSSFPMASGFEVRNQGPQERIINSHQELGLDVQDALWNQTTSAPNFMWMQQAINARKENLPMFFWDQQPPAMASNSLRPEMMPKDIKSEDEILAQIRAPQNNPNTSQNEILAQLRAPQNNPNTSQNEILAQLRAPQNNPNTSQNEILAQLRAPQNNPNTSQNEILAQLRAPQNNPNTSQNEILAQLRAPQNNPNTSQSLYYVKEPPNTGSTAIKEDNFRQPNLAMALTVEKLEKQMQEKQPLPAQAMIKMPAAQLLQKQFTDVLPTSSFNQIPQQLIQSKESTDAKVTKLPKVENEKAKIKDCPVTKNESNKSKEDKKEEITDTKTIENDVKIQLQKRSSEASTVKNKKEDKATKKELMKERKEWVKEGFTIVKEKKPESKKAKEDILLLLMAGETERRRQDEENRVAEEMKLKSLESYKDYQETPKQQQRQQQADLVTRKAPWSAMANLTLQDTTQEGLTLAEIQQLEREKKLQQIKEQQQMIQIITQQHAAALAREQEAQASLGWIKKKGSMNMAAQTLAEIQADARKQSMAAAAAAQVQEEPLVPPTTNVSWTKSSNGAGFWDTQLASARVPEEPANVNLGKTKKKVKVTPPVKKEPSPSADFEAWCMTALISWSTKIDVPTFVGFLKDIESPYEVKDYVKCYLGESRDSSDFAHQFLERRSKMLRVGLVTPPDDLCSPAMAINPRSNSTSDYQELKGKAKKPKKNKMLKVDARILGFSVTAAEDRINVGDIDTA